MTDMNNPDGLHKDEHAADEHNEIPCEDLPLAQGPADDLAPRTGIPTAGTAHTCPADSRTDDSGLPDPAQLQGRASSVVPGFFGEPVEVTHANYSSGNARRTPNRPLFLCLHGWGSNEDDLADMMRYVAPYNDYISLRAPLVLQEARPSSFFMQAGAYSWFHDAVPTGDDLDRDAYAASVAVDNWVAANVPDEREIVPIGFSQGGLLAVHLLRAHPERYRAAVSLSGFVAPGKVPGTAPADGRLAELNIPTFYGYGTADTVVPKYEIFAAIAWLEEHTWLTEKSYRGLDHSVCMDEFADMREWLLAMDITSGML